MAVLSNSPYKSITEKAQARVAAVLMPGDRAIDATVGNGNDTFFLANEVGPEGLVIGFDIQDVALQRATIILGEAQLLNRVRLLNHSHDRMGDWVPTDWVGHVKAIMFNLGYLPRGNKSIITRAETTIPALNAALELLAPGGCITVAVYIGHEGGPQEGDAVRNWIQELSPITYDVELILSDSDGDTAPHLFVINKIG